MSWKEFAALAPSTRPGFSSIAYVRPAFAWGVRRWRGWRSILSWLWPFGWEIVRTADPFGPEKVIAFRHSARGAAAALAWMTHDVVKKQTEAKARAELLQSTLTTEEGTEDPINADLERLKRELRSTRRSIMASAIYVRANTQHDASVGAITVLKSDLGGTPEEAKEALLQSDGHKSQLAAGYQMVEIKTSEVAGDISVGIREPLSRLLARFANDQAELKAIRTSVAPVLDWFQSDEHPAKPLHKVIFEAVLELQGDRKTLIDQGNQIRALEQELIKLRAERDHWKANHDEMVTRNQLLRNRPDLPIERAQGYDALVDQIREADIRRDAARRACEWAMSNPQGTPVPEWIDWATRDHRADDPSEVDFRKNHEELLDAILVYQGFFTHGFWVDPEGEQWQTRDPNSYVEGEPVWTDHAKVAQAAIDAARRLLLVQSGGTPQESP